MTKKELHNIRLKNEYELMKNMKGKSKVIDFTVDDPDKPERYTVTFNIRTIIGKDANGKPIYRDRSVVDITLSKEHPEVKPTAKMQGTPPFHPNWYVDGTYCPGIWHSEEALWSYVRRMAETLQFSPDITNPNSPANPAAVPFWNENRKMFPIDRQELPTGEKKKSRCVIHF